MQCTALRRSKPDSNRISMGNALSYCATHTHWWMCWAETQFNPTLFASHRCHAHCKFVYVQKMHNISAMLWQVFRKSCAIAACFSFQLRTPRLLFDFLFIFFGPGPDLWPEMQEFPTQTAIFVWFIFGESSNYSSTSATLLHYYSVVSVGAAAPCGALPWCTHSPQTA